MVPASSHQEWYAPTVSRMEINDVIVNLHSTRCRSVSTLTHPYWWLFTRTVMIVDNYNFCAHFRVNFSCFCAFLSFYKGHWKICESSASRLRVSCEQLASICEYLRVFASICEWFENICELGAASILVSLPPLSCCLCSKHSPAEERWLAGGFVVLHHRRVLAGGGLGCFAPMPAVTCTVVLFFWTADLI